MTASPANDEPTATGLKVACPSCGRELALYTIPDKPGRVQAFCNHGNLAQPPRAVYETDAAAGPARLEEV